MTKQKCDSEDTKRSWIWHPRHLSDRFLSVLQEKCSFLLEIPTWNRGEDVRVFDLQFRVGDKLAVCHGFHTLLSIEFKPETEMLTLSTGHYYSKLPLFEELISDHEPADLCNQISRIESYLFSALALSKVRHPKKYAKAYWMSRFSIDMGKQWKKGLPWLIIDRNTLIGFVNEIGKNIYHDCDFLAVSPGGELACLELLCESKLNTHSLNLEYSRIVACSDVLADALPWIGKDIETLIQQKLKVGLLPDSANALLKSTCFSRVRPRLIVPNTVASPAEAAWLSQLKQRRRSEEVGVVEFFDFQEI